MKCKKCKYFIKIIYGRYRGLHLIRLPSFDSFPSRGSLLKQQPRQMAGLPNRVKIGKGTETITSSQFSATD